MRLAKAWTVASKDYKIFTKKKSILYSIVAFEVFVSFGLPLLLLFIARKPSTLTLLPLLINSFSFWLVMEAAFVPIGIASYSIVGEKVQKSLEPLLATPTTDEEILVGKALAAFLPALASTFIGAAIYMFFVDVFTTRILGYRYYPNGMIAIFVFILAPLTCIFSIGYNVLVSSRTNDIRAAQQLGTLIILPFGAVYVLSEISVLPLTTNNTWIIAAVLLVFDVIVFSLVRTTFRREEILTRWR